MLALLPVSCGVWAPASISSSKWERYRDLPHRRAHGLLGSHVNYTEEEGPHDPSHVVSVTGGITWLHVTVCFIVRSPSTGLGAWSFSPSLYQCHRESDATREGRQNVSHLSDSCARGLPEGKTQILTHPYTQLKGYTQLEGGLRLPCSPRLEQEQELNASFQGEGLDLDLPVSFLLLICT